MITLNDIKNFKSTHNIQENVPLKSIPRFLYFFNKISTENVIFNKIKFFMISKLFYNYNNPSDSDNDLTGLGWLRDRYERLIKISLKDYKDETI